MLIEIVEELLDEPYVTCRRTNYGEGYGIKNDPDAQPQVAYWLQATCGYTELQIEETLSRFQQAGGFDAYDRGEVLGKLDNW